MTYLWRHPKSGMYYFRRAVPPELRGRVGKTMLKRTLGTKDVKIAKRLIPAVTVEVDAFLGQFENEAQLTAAQVQEITNNWLAHWLAVDSEFRMDPAVPKLPPERIEELTAEHKADLAAGRLRHVEDEARDFADASGFPMLSPASLGKLSHALLRAEVVLGKRRAERAAGYWREDD
ncbi:MAG TPA: DUF6538 domain-containing protein, partial [Aliidongia sp.]|nr:DUF6538 domain-containing protein [Aliidongia sp.]